MNDQEQPDSEESESDFRPGVEPGLGNLRDHKDFKEAERQIAQLFGRDTTKGGRPTVGEVQFREFYYKFANFKLFDQFIQKQGEEPIEKGKKRYAKNNGGLLSGLFGDILGRDFLDNLEGEYKEQLTGNLAKIGGIATPLIVGMFVLYQIENKQISNREQGKKNKIEIPEFLHAGQNVLSLLNTFVQLLNMVLLQLVKFLGGDISQIAKQTTQSVLKDLIVTKYDENGKPVETVPLTMASNKKQADAVQKLKNGDIVGALIDLAIGGIAGGFGF